MQVWGAHMKNLVQAIAVALMLVPATSLAQDHTDAVKWTKLAAEQGDAEAQHSLGVMYANSQGVPQDFAKAVNWYKLAAEQGIAEAQFNLCVMYANGSGVPKNNPSAFMWCVIASENGLSSSDGMRDNLAAALSPQDVADARRRANECLESNYRDWN